MVQKRKQYKRSLYNSLVNSFILKGKKKTAKTIIDNTMLNLCRSLNTSIIRLLFSVYFKLDSFIEIKQVKIKRRTYTIPFAVSYIRRIYLILKKIKGATKSDKRKIPTSEKLKSELNNVLSASSNSKAIKLLKSNQVLVRSSQANTHFRWK